MRSLEASKTSMGGSGRQRVKKHGSRSSLEPEGSMSDFSRGVGSDLNGSEFKISRLKKSVLDSSNSSLANEENDILSSSLFLFIFPPTEKN